jgi:hypothetical protein
MRLSAMLASRQLHPDYTECRAAERLDGSLPGHVERGYARHDLVRARRMSGCLGPSGRFNGSVPARRRRKDRNDYDACQRCVTAVATADPAMPQATPNTNAAQRVMPSSTTG